MAGDWIKIEHSLPGKPEVMRLASRLGIDEMAVVGHLVIFWSWVDQNLSPDCPAAIGTNKGLDRVVGRDGFVDAMIEVGWLSFSDGKVEIPNYDHHLSESAKKRALEARKKHRQRNSSRKSPATVGTNVPQPSGQNGGPEKRERREEENSKKEKKEIGDTAYFSYLEDPDFGVAWRLYLQTRTAVHGKPAESTIESWFLDLSRFSISEAVEILRLSTSAEAKKPITNGDHNRTATRQAVKKHIDLRIPVTDGSGK